MGKANNRSENRRGAVVWTTLALVGAAALAYVFVRRLHGDGDFDVDALLTAADEAANNLDAILMSEGAAIG